MVLRAESVTFNLTGAGDSKEIFNEFAMQYIDRVIQIPGGWFKIEYLVACVALTPFCVQDAAPGALR
ncbi:MAG: hypothetical protein NUV51_00765 [Sulfuricaulis sp.]|nr:hypothetical protein [Sulfuricaulis sp.]